MLQLVDASFQGYSKTPAPETPQPRWTRGGSYVPPAPCTQTKLGNVTIVSGKTYRVVPKMTTHGGVQIGEKMIAAENNRGEMLLCRLQNGKAFGGYRLRNFISAVPVE